jgi:hypothetical protein
VGYGGAIVAISYRAVLNGGGFNYGVPGSGQITARCDSAKWSGTPRPLARPRYFQVIDKIVGGAPASYLLVCDNYGVYKIGPMGAAVPDVVQAVLDADYRTANRDLIQEKDGQVIPVPPGGLGAPLIANSAQELPNGHWLISNGYSGTDKMPIAGGGAYDGPANSFSGEVFECDPDTKDIVWSAPSLICPAIPIPGGTYQYDPTVRRQSVGNSYTIHQPRSALRQF